MSVCTYACKTANRRRGEGACTYFCSAVSVGRVSDNDKRALENRCHLTSQTPLAPRAFRGTDFLRGTCYAEEIVEYVIIGRKSERARVNENSVRVCEVGALRARSWKSEKTFEKGYPARKSQLGGCKIIDAYYSGVQRAQDVKYCKTERASRFIDQALT